MNSEYSSGLKDDSLDKVLEKIGEITRRSANDRYIYRGEPRHFEEVSSGLFRQVRSKHSVDDFIAMQEGILREARNYTHRTEDFAILTELQHFGGTTNLIDFTTDFMVALFFACDGFPGEDGRIILLGSHGDENTIIEPRKNMTSRVVSQKSVFVQTKAGFVNPSDVINVSHNLKLPILKYLRKFHAISPETLYGDLHGFIKYQKIHLDASAEMARGSEYQMSGMHEDAIKAYDKALEMNPQFMGAYNNRGISRAELGHNQEAIADFSEAIQISPGEAEIYSNRGHARVNIGHYEKAIEDLTEALRIRPSDSIDLGRRGVAKFFLGRYEEAIADQDAAVQFNSEDAQAFFDRGMAWAALGQTENALADFTEATRINPEHVDALANRGVAKSRLGRKAEAIEDLEQAEPLAFRKGRFDLLEFICRKLQELRTNETATKS